jgi:putative FmdB family regulatory protein
MPSYDYECETCGVFTQFRPIAERDVPATCGICDGRATRVISAPHLAVMSPIHRMAASRNERSQHEPRVGGPKKSCCATGKCAHKKGSRQKSGDKPALRASTKKNRRPWMLGH